jgi:LAS superfamily LD-carboxypeptidase LdcB
MAGVNGYGTAAYRWLANNARRYGFVNDVRGESWHWTYRG